MRASHEEHHRGTVNLPSCCYYINIHLYVYVVVSVVIFQYQNSSPAQPLLGHPYILIDSLSVLVPRAWSVSSHHYCAQTENNVDRTNPLPWIPHGSPFWGNNGINISYEARTVSNV